MQLIFPALALLRLASLGSAVPLQEGGNLVARDTATTASADTLSSTCRSAPVRKEWRSLSSTDKKAYINAVLCLTKKTAKSGITGAINRFDDHQAVHSDQTPAIHWVGHFILWHRYFVATYEKALRNECGYTGAQPYWDWSLDASSTNNQSTAIFNTAIFDPTTGLGGNGAYVDITDPSLNPFNLTGRTGGGCVKNGPFVPSAFTVNYPTPGCLKRDMIPWIMNYFAQKSLVANVVAAKTYTDFAYRIEGIPSFSAPNIHGSGHFGVGGVLGTIGNAYQSPGDPLFYLHHGNLDRIFWSWQQKDTATRYNQVGGPVTPFDYGGVNVTLDFQVNIGKLASSTSLKSLLNTQGGTLCYTYDKAWS